MNFRARKLSLVAWLAISSAAGAQTISAPASPASQEVVSIKSVRFANALVEKWVAEYSKACPDAKLSVAGKEDGKPSLEVVPFGVRKDDAVQETSIVSFGRYAILPIAGKDNALPDELKKKKLNEKRIKELFFERDLLDEYDEASKKIDVTVYSGNHSYSVSHSFAEHFGYKASSLKGKKIAGDDIYLNSVVQKDLKGVSFNNLSYIFNLETRRLNEGIALFPLDVKKEYAEKLNEQNLDETIALLESKNVDLIPVAELSFVLPKDASPAIVRFVEWALTDGQAYIHSFGFLRLDAKTLAQQQAQVNSLETKALLSFNKQ